MLWPDRCTILAVLEMQTCFALLIENSSPFCQNGRSSGRIMSKTFAYVLFVAVSVSSLLAKDNIFQTVNWPDSGQTVLRFSFSKFKDVGGMGKAHTYLTDTTV